MVDIDQTKFTSDSTRRVARKRIERRRALQGGVAAYVVVNAFLIGVWATSGGGYFWPGWVLAGWGVALALGLWEYVRGPVTDADVDKEVRRMR